MTKPDMGGCSKRPRDHGKDALSWVEKAFFELTR
jgi:hypothetical protein